jgi:hypothetical protein
MPLRTFVVTMKAMHGCERMRHEMHGIAFQGARCSESNVGGWMVQGLYHSNVRVPWRLDIWEPHGGEPHG